MPCARNERVAHGEVGRRRRLSQRVRPACSKLPQLRGKRHCGAASMGHSLQQGTHAALRRIEVAQHSPPPLPAACPGLGRAPGGRHAAQRPAQSAGVRGTRGAAGVGRPSRIGRAGAWGRGRCKVPRYPSFAAAAAIASARSGTDACALTTLLTCCRFCPADTTQTAPRQSPWRSRLRAPLPAPRMSRHCLR